MSGGQFQFRSRVRGVTDIAVTTLAILATLIVVTPLVVIFGYLIFKGAASLNPAFFTHVPAPPGESVSPIGRRTTVPSASVMCRASTTFSVHAMDTTGSKRPG